MNNKFKVKPGTRVWYRGPTSDFGVDEYFEKWTVHSIVGHDDFPVAVLFKKVNNSLRELFAVVTLAFANTGQEGSLLPNTRAGRALAKSFNDAHEVAEGVIFRKTGDWKAEVEGKKS
jgi:hypothetical protein